MKFSIKDFYSNQNPQVDLVTYTEELLNGNIFCATNGFQMIWWGKYNHKN